LGRWFGCRILYGRPRCAGKLMVEVRLPGILASIEPAAR